jgi:tRNA threonylcarbamoyl adenosine modification protein (Sua5/YciO/YrdC/YwlC family)
MNSELDHAAIGAAGRLLEQGQLVAFPTETVYGLGADAENPDAVARIYAAKGRPQDHPVIVHLAPDADLAYWASDIPPQAAQLAAAFWPGPLTMILKRHPQIPDAVSGGQDTVGLRCPSHPVAIALLQAFKGGRGGVAAPSANKFGNVSPTLAQHVRDEFGMDGTVAMVLDGGQSQVGIESTIVDLSRLATHGPVLLRPGHISADAIAAVIALRPAHPGGDAGQCQRGCDTGPAAGGRAQSGADPLQRLRPRPCRTAPAGHAGRFRARPVCGAAQPGRQRRRPDPGGSAPARGRLGWRQRPPAPRRARLERHRARPAEPGSPHLTPASCGEGPLICAGMDP